MDPFQFVDQSDHINTVYNTNDETQLVDSQKEHTREYDKKWEVFDDAGNNAIYEE